MLKQVQHPVPAEPSSPSRGGGSGVTCRVVTVPAGLRCFLTNPQARAAPEGDECCALGQLLQHSTKKALSGPRFHLCISPAPSSQRLCPALRDPGTALSCPCGEGHRQGQPGMAAVAQSGLPCSSWAPQRGQQGLQPSHDPKHLLWKCGTNPCTVPFKQCWNLLPSEGTSLG